MEGVNDSNGTDKGEQCKRKNGVVEENKESNGTDKGESWKRKKGVVEESGSPFSLLLLDFSLPLLPVFSSTTPQRNG